MVTANETPLSSASRFPVAGSGAVTTGASLPDEEEHQAGEHGGDHQKSRRRTGSFRKIGPSSSR